jgi:AcrR family transcriptional regulator
MSSEKITTKIRILDTTWKLLEARDKNTRMSDIAKAVGISRQALYLHFPTRAALLIATTRHVDYVKNVDRRLEASRAARTGIERLDAFIEAWGGYIPEIHGLSVALRGMLESDGAVRDAWNDRMQAVRHGCEAAVRAIAKDGLLNPDLSKHAATDFLWTLLSVENWERLVHECGWTQSAYQERMQAFAKVALLKKSAPTT